MRALARGAGMQGSATAPDLRGHGSASDRQPVDLATVLSDVEALAPERFILAGYSMGGRVALHLAASQPDRVERLILIGASPGIADAAARAARRHSDDELADAIERSTIEEFAARWSRTPILAGLPPSVLERVQEDRRRSTPAGLARALRGLGTGVLPPLWSRLGELTVPVTLVVGERDEKFRAIASRMAKSISKAQVIVVAGCGHAVHLEAPERVAEVIGAGGSGDRR